MLNSHWSEQQVQRREGRLSPVAQSEGKRLAQVKPALAMRSKSYP
jgi:hypothetical protein